jgi:superfamily II DNA or RNA helicase
MITLAAEVLDPLKIGYAVLHGGLPGKERKAVLEQFHTDPECRVFLSTDAGGTGLNLQVADTVVNLELPWNPAVLEQRIARVHRMGQLQPVRVVNFVTQGTIEEKVQRTLAQKQNLFAGVFDGDEDELAFGAASRAGFLDAVRELIGEGRTPPSGQQTPSLAAPTEAMLPVLQMTLTLLETAAPVLNSVRELDLPADWWRRVRAAVVAINAAVAAKPG